MPPINTTLCASSVKAKVASSSIRRLSTFDWAELEARQIAMHRELGRMQLVANRTHVPVRVFGLKQVLDQPA